MKSVTILVLLVLTVASSAQPRILYPGFPLPSNLYCYGDSGVVSLYCTGYGQITHGSTNEGVISILRSSTNAGSSWWKESRSKNALGYPAFPLPSVILDSVTAIAVRFIGLDTPRTQYTQLVRTSDGGTTWHECLNEIRSAQVTISFLNDSVGTVCDQDSVFWHTVDGGITWKRILVPRIREDYPNHYHAAYPIAENCWILRVESNGQIDRYRATRTSIHNVISDGPYSYPLMVTTMNKPDSTTIVACNMVIVTDRPGPDQTIAWIERSTDDGVSWSTCLSFVSPRAKDLLGTVYPIPLLKVEWFNDSVGIVAADSIYRTTDRGKSWNSIGAEGAIMSSCSASGFGIVFGVSTWRGKLGERMRSTISHTYDYGATWTVQTENRRLYERITEVVRDVRSGVLYLRNGPYVSTSVDGGSSWRENAIPFYDWEKQFETPGYDYPRLVVGESGRVHLGIHGYTDDGGTTWISSTRAFSTVTPSGRCVRGRYGCLIQPFRRNDRIYLARSCDRGISWQVLDSIHLEGSDIIGDVLVQGQDSIIAFLLTKREYSVPWYKVWTEWPYERWSYRRVISPPLFVDKLMDTRLQESVSITGTTVLLFHRDYDTLVVSHDLGDSWILIRYSQSPLDGIRGRKDIVRIHALPDGTLFYADRVSYRHSTDDGSTWRFLTYGEISYPLHITDGQGSGLWIEKETNGGKSGLSDNVILEFPSELLLSTSTCCAPPSFTLPPAWPNPASTQGAVHLPYELSSPAEVTIVIRDILGRVVARLDQGRRDVGRHEALWQPRGLGPGVYLTQVSVGSGRVAMGKVVVR